jgi:hypothetical protein
MFCRLTEGFKMGPIWRADLTEVLIELQKFGAEWRAVIAAVGCEISREVRQGMRIRF